jgi:ech hydrogenase subunit D
MSELDSIQERPDGKLIEIDRKDIMSKAMRLKTDGYRIVQICAVTLEDRYELSYSFAREYEMVNLRISVQEGEEVASISDIFTPAFLYENEIRDLFGVNIQMISLDYEGNLYRIEKKTPFKKD